MPCLENSIPSRGVSSKIPGAMGPTADGGFTEFLRYCTYLHTGPTSSTSTVEYNTPNRTKFVNTHTHTHTLPPPKSSSDLWCVARWGVGRSCSQTSFNYDIARVVACLLTHPPVTGKYYTLLTRSLAHSLTLTSVTVLHAFSSKLLVCGGETGYGRQYLLRLSGTD